MWAAVALVVVHLGDALLRVVLFRDHEVRREHATALPLAVGAVTHRRHRRLALEFIAHRAAQASTVSAGHAGSPVVKC